MTIAKQMEIRANIKKYFDMANAGEVVIVPRKQGKNVVIISEEEYNNLNRIERIGTYARNIDHSSFGKGIESVKPEDIRSDNLKKLHNISLLKDDWNGNGAPAFTGILIDKVADIIRRLPIQPEIFPTALQTIQLEYDNSRHDHMEIEIDGSDTASVFIVPYSGNESEESIPSDIASLTERVMQFYG